MGPPGLPVALLAGRWRAAHGRGAGGLGRKAARRYVEAAQGTGLVRGGVCQLSDELIGAVVGVRASGPRGGHGAAWCPPLTSEVVISDPLLVTCSPSGLRG